MVLKVRSLSHNLEADGTLVTGVILEGFSLHPDLVGNVDNSLDVSIKRRLRVGCLRDAVIEPDGGVVIINALDGAAVIHSNNILAGSR